MKKILSALAALAIGCSSAVLAEEPKNLGEVISAIGEKVCPEVKGELQQLECWGDHARLIGRVNSLAKSTAAVVNAAVDGDKEFYEAAVAEVRLSSDRLIKNVESFVAKYAAEE